MEATKEQFFALASQQRDLPEKAMLRVQRIMGGGVMNEAVEHVGDLIHRMSEANSFAYGGYSAVKEKVDKTLRWLTQGYGFEREFLENIKENAKHFNLPEEEMKFKVFAALEEYALAHEQLPIYNQAQKLARFAAISLGRRKFATTITALKILQSHLTSSDEWVRFAHEGLNDIS